MARVSNAARVQEEEWESLQPAFDPGWDGSDRVAGDFSTGLLPTRATRILTLLSLLLAAAWWTVPLERALTTPLQFDDAYMFYRYAVHIREGLGMSWNLDGAHTYGETSPLWGFVVLALSYLPLGMAKTLVLGSWLCSLGAMVALAWAVARNSVGKYMSSPWRVLPLVAVPLAAMYIFQANAVTGMETMLATLLCAVYVGLVLGWAKGTVSAAVVGLAGLPLFMTRPESALVVVSMPVLAYLLLPGPTKKGLTTLLAVFFGCVVLDLAVSKLYFGTPLPLAFYMKSLGGYKGYRGSWAPTMMTITMLVSCWPYLGLLAVAARRTNVRRIAVCLVPAFLVFAYLCTVMQIMGFASRYYLPYLPLFVVPALLVLDQRMCGERVGESRFRPLFRVTVAGCAAMLLLLTLFVVNHKVVKIRPLLSATDQRLEHRYVAYDPVHFRVAATERLPERYWLTELHEITDVLLKPLPKSSTITASEVGLLGAGAPQVNVIDLAGLNDAQIALHGFDVDELLARKPDIIWMPHTDYTYQRGQMLSNPHLLEQYDVYVGAFTYGMALRKDSPVRPLIDRQMEIAWNDLYPGYKMNDYLVQDASWTGKTRPIDVNVFTNVAADEDQLESK